MPVKNAPGVYSREIDLSLFVEAFSPTIMGMVGTATTGPVDSAVFTSSQQQWLYTFGPPVSLAGYAALQFLKRGSQLFFLRVAGSGKAKPTITVPDADRPASLLGSESGPFTLTASTYASHTGSANAPFLFQNEVVASWTGGAAASNLAAFQAVSNGDLTLTLDGVTSTVTGINFSTATTVAGPAPSVKTLLEAAIAAHVPFGTSTIVVSAPGALGYTIETGAYGASGDISLAVTVGGSGTDIYPLLGGNGSDDVVAGEDGTDELTITETLLNPASSTPVTIDFVPPDDPPTTLSITQVVDAINAALTHVTASEAIVLTNSRLKLTHNVPGAGNQFVIANPDGSAATTLGLTPATYNGTTGTDKLIITFTNGGAAPDGPVHAYLGADPTASKAVTAINAAIAYQYDGAGEAQMLTTSTGQQVEIHTADAGVSSTIQATAGAAATALGMDAVLHTGVDAVGTSLTFSERYYGNTGMSIRLFRGTAFIPVVNEVFLVKVYQGTQLVETHDNVRKTASTSAEEAFLFESVIGIDGQDSNGKDPYITVEDEPLAGAPVITDTANGDLYTLATVATDPSGLTTVATADYIGVLLPIPTGLQVFRNAQRYETTLLACPGVSTDAVHRELIDIAETRQDLLCLPDPPVSLSVQQINDWHNAMGSYAAGRTALNSSYAALYWPWVQVFDSVRNQDLWTAPSGNASAVIAYSHAVSEPWLAPAGTTRGRLPWAKSLEVDVTDGDRAFLQLNLNRVNTFVNFARTGIVAFSELTLLRTNSMLAKIHVRFLLLIARKAIMEAMRSFNFEPDDPVSWELMENKINPFLGGIAANRGLEDFKIVINDRTNTPQYRAQGTGRGVIFLIPTSAMEDIQFDFVIGNQTVSIAALESAVL